MSTLENSEDPHKMLHNAAFYKGIHCLLRQSMLRERNTILFGNHNL